MELRSNVPVDHLEIIGNGKVVARIPLRGDRAELPVLDLYPFASTSPIYVRVGDQPVRSAVDAAFFVRWIERLETATRASTAWNTSGEQAEVLRMLGQARAVFTAQAR